ncbi:MAG: Orotidine 5'-phosphate decarboxylase [Candidatus Yanofskybacteria bacterium GW2011_GWC1_48_11]|uniref:Orotidine 5'-phosphate decarboxylase n=1 Tax=Candidatus Yanofskybacteria bacterium GW2011_GWC1_48_11 TaxID=1619027 RepID=A0A837IK99_9BACT|nr:MAG: Orotidine 5'-phosphate decarboxylase [Candidatus Yanofskybacteria bacterium GW2011_GWC1_48_11]
MGMRILKPAERLIVAADFKPDPKQGQGRDWVRGQVLTLAESLKGTGVYIKVNSVLRACGYDLVGKIQGRGLRVFADLKLHDISETLSTDGVLLQEFRPELLTVVCTAGITARRALKAELPYTEVLGVTVLTSLGNADTRAVFTCSTEGAVLRLAQLAEDAAIDGLVLSAKEAETIRANFGIMMTLNTPGIRPEWAIVVGDDQNPERVMTPAKAIRAGADRIVVGRPIVRAKEPYEATMRIIEEIASMA